MQDKFPVTLLAPSTEEMAEEVCSVALLHLVKAQREETVVCLSLYALSQMSQERV